MGLSERQWARTQAVLFLTADVAACWILDLVRDRCLRGSSWP
jgi:hypothetical protein